MYYFFVTFFTADVAFFAALTTGFLIVAVFLTTFLATLVTFLAAGAFFAAGAFLQLYSLLF